MNEDMPIIGMGCDFHLHTNQKDEVHAHPTRLFHHKQSTEDSEGEQSRPCRVIQTIRGTCPPV